MCDKLTKPDDGGPAFPCDQQVLADGWTGLSVRDWFAGQILAGVLARREIGVDDVARIYAAADAMLRARREGAK